MKRTIRALVAIGAILAVLAAALVAPAAGDVSDTDEIRFRAVGHTGTEKVRVTVNGDAVGWKTLPRAGGSFWSNPTGWKTYTFEVAPLETGDVVRVEFTNNGRTSTREDRNVRVDWIRVAGVKTETEAPSTESVGVWSNGGRCAPGTWESEVLACNGWFEVVASIVDPPPAPTTTTTAPSSTTTTAPSSTTTTAPPATTTSSTVPSSGVTIAVAAVGSTGEERIRVDVAGETVHTFTARAATRGFWSGDPGWASVTFEAPTAGDVRLHFTDGVSSSGADMNVRINWIEVDGARFEAEHADVTTSGGWGNGSRCTTGSFGIDNLVCSGWMNFPVAGSTPAPTPTPAPGPGPIEGTLDVATIGDSNTASGYWRKTFIDTAACDVEMVGQFSTYWDIVGFGSRDADTDAVSGSVVIKSWIGGSDMFDHADRTLANKPDVAVVMGGTNDILSANVDTTGGRGRITDVTAGIRGHLLDAMAVTPGTRFIVVAVPPLENNLQASDALNDAVAGMVAGLAAQGHPVAYIDPSASVADLHDDGVHLNAAGGDRYGRAIAVEVCG